MRKFIMSLVFAAFAGGLSEVNAAFVIRLKNGNEFLTGRYWHEGAQVMFDTYGGVFGIDRGFVAKIEQSDKLVKSETQAQEMPEQKPQAETGKDKMDAAKATTPKVEARREEDPILKDFYVLKDKSKRLQGMLSSELQEFDKELTNFKKRVRESRRLDAYMKELAEAEELGDAMEAILKTRR